MVRSARPKCYLAVSIALFLLCSCGDDSGESSPPPFPAEDADLVATAFDIGWREDSFSAPAGEVAVLLADEGSFHTLLIEDPNGDVVDGFELEVKRTGDVDSGYVTLDAGEYMVFCDIPGHRAAGMEAPLTVTSS